MLFYKRQLKLTLSTDNWKVTLFSCYLKTLEGKFYMNQI